MKKIVYSLAFFLAIIFTWQVSAQITNFPWTEDFEASTNLPSGWAKELGDPSANDIIIDTIHNHTQNGSHSVRFSSYSSANDYNQYLFSPQIHVTSPYTELHFWHKKSDSDESLEWGIATAQSSGSVGTWTSVNLSTDWQEEIIDLSAYDGQDIYIAWHYYGDYSYYVYLDDVSIVEPPSCPDPENVTATPSTSTETVITWDAGSSSTWNLEYGPHGFSQGSGTMVNGLTSPTYTITGLTSGNDYDVYVQTDCSSGGNGTSGWVMASWHQPYSTCSDPVVLTVNPNENGGAYTLDFTTADDVGHFSCDNYGINHGRWFKFTTPASGRVKMISSNDGNEFVLLDGCGGNEVECGDAHENHILTGLTPGSDYIIAYWNNNATSGTVDVKLVDIPFEYTITPNPDCDNQQFTVDVEITDLGGASSVTVTDDQGSASQQVTSAPGTVTFGPYASGTTVNFTITSNDDSNSYMNDSTTYLCPPPNDDCENAYEIASLPYSLNEDASSATGGSVNICSNNVHDGVWYKMTVGTANGDITVGVDPDGWNAEIQVFSGNDCNSLTCVGRADSNGAGGHEEISFTPTDNSTYYILVGYYDGSSSTPQYGPLTINVTGSSTLTANTLDFAGFRLYPNPANNILHIAADKKVDNIRITNMSGQTLLEQNINATASQIDISRLPAGVYMLTATVEGQTGTYRLIKE